MLLEGSTWRKERLNALERGYRTKRRRLQCVTACYGPVIPAYGSLRVSYGL